VTKAHRRMLYPLLAAAVVLVAASCGGGGGGGGGVKKGTGTVSVLSLWGGSEQEAFQKVLNAFTQKTGIKTKYESARDFLPVIRTRLAAGNPPMVAIIPRPGIVTDLAKEGSLKSLDDLGLDPAAINKNYSKAWTDLTTVDGKTYGVVAKANSKSTVWYHPDSFQKLGVQPPATYDDMLAIAKKYEDQGDKPWGLGAKDAWTLTDWFENIYLRQAGPDKYAQLFSGKLDFTDPSVSEALKTMTDTLNNSSVAGGIDGALGTDFVSGIGQVFGKNPKAQMYMEGGFVGGIALSQVNTDLKPDKDIKFFPFPVFKSGETNPLLGGGDITAAFVANEDVKKLVEYLASPEAGKIWVSTGAIVSPNKGVTADAYPNPLVKAEAEQVKNATVFRFDGSDLLPGSLGDDWGTVLQTVFKDPSKIDSQLKSFQTQASDAFASG
jgi:alpha-glucoside transport system substrate-binding protein